MLSLKVEPLIFIDLLNAEPSHGLRFNIIKRDWTQWGVLIIENAQVAQQRCK